MFFFIASNKRFCVECVVTPVVVALILISLLLIGVLLIALYWYKQRKAKLIHSRNSPVNQIQLEKVDTKAADKDVENVYSNGHAVSNEDVNTLSEGKPDTV